MSQYCPHTSKCPFYGNWLDYTRDRRIDVIIFQEHHENARHDCLTLIALDDPETGIPIGEDLERDLSEQARIKNINCPLNSLNGPNYLQSKIEKLLRPLTK